MPKVAKDRGIPSDLTFESAMARLEEVVESMQSPELPLDQIIERYEEGMKLMAFCGSKLAAAEQKIELLTREKSGKFTPSVVDGKGEASGQKPHPSPTHDGDGDEPSEEVRLF
jgi:exodeoxyribonuclease VII small subunit